MTALAPAPRADLAAIRLRPGGIVHSEVLKLVTVRSTWWSVAASTMHLQFVGPVVAVLGAFSVGFAALLRSTAAAIGVAVGVMFVLLVVAAIVALVLWVLAVWLPALTLTRVRDV